MRLFTILFATMLMLTLGEAQNADGPYRLHREDVIFISVWNEPSLTQETPISRDGFISVPLVGVVKVEGMTVSELEEYLERIYKEKGYFRDPQVAVTIRQFYRPRVTLLGMFNRPGVYEFKYGDRLLDALSLGANYAIDRADLDRARLEREDGTVLTLSLRKLIEEGDTSLNVELKDNDTIIIPEDTLNRVFVGGQVPRPGQFPWKPRMTVLDALGNAGWSTERGMTSQTYVLRQKEDGSAERIRVDMVKLVRKGDLSQNIALQRGDMLYVPETRTPDLDRLYRSLSVLWLGKRILDTDFWRF